MALRSFEGLTPTIGDDVFIADGAHVIGDVHLGDQVGVWFNAVIRGDVFHIRIGDRTNIQDNSVIHVTTDTHPTIIANDVTIGHRALLHGCTVDEWTLVGMGSVIMDEAHIGHTTLVGAGSLIPPRMIVPPKVLVLGSPAKVRRELTETEIEALHESSPRYVKLARRYLDDQSKGTA